MNDRQFRLSDEFLPPIVPGVIEEELYTRGHKQIAGLDEAGRGPLAGPVVAAAVVFPRGLSHCEIRDSKSLSGRQRDNLVPSIKQNALAWAIGVVEVEEIDRSNILDASLRAMAKALMNLRLLPDCLLIDGDQIIPGELFERSKILFQSRPQQRAVVSGDQLCFSIAAASILAKVARDAIMFDLDRCYPEYGFAHHKGYGSAEHLEALRRHGPCPAHRRSFKPVRDLCSGMTHSDLPLFSLAVNDE
jgi:ribonuclease HII